MELFSKNKRKASFPCLSLLRRDTSNFHLSFLVAAISDLTYCKLVRVIWTSDDTKFMACLSYRCFCNVYFGVEGMGHFPPVQYSPLAQHYRKHDGDYTKSQNTACGYSCVLENTVVFIRLQAVDSAHARFDISRTRVLAQATVHRQTYPVSYHMYSPSLHHKMARPAAALSHAL